MGDSVEADPSDTTLRRRTILSVTIRVSHYWDRLLGFHSYIFPIVSSASFSMLALFQTLRRHRCRLLRQRLDFSTPSRVVVTSDLAGSGRRWSPSDWLSEHSCCRHGDVSLNCKILSVVLSLQWGFLNERPRTLGSVFFLRSLASVRCATGYLSFEISYSLALCVELDMAARRGQLCQVLWHRRFCCVFRPPYSVGFPCPDRSF